MSDELEKPAGKTLMEVFGLTGNEAYESHPFGFLFKPQEGVQGPGFSDSRDWAIVAYHRDPVDSRNIRVTFFKVSGQLPADDPEIRRLLEAFEKLVSLSYQKEHDAPTDMDVALVRIDPAGEPRNYVECAVCGRIEVLAGSQTDGHFKSRPIPVIDLRPGRLRSDRPRTL